MSTISVNFINGSKGSVCRNDAYSVVKTENGETRLLDIIPATDLTEEKVEQLSTVYQKAINDCVSENRQQITSNARRTLGL